jgi:23S rRNA (cytosine1962-C5)-methyltransferase
MNIKGAMELSQIRLKPGKDISTKRFHPWIFSGAVEGVRGELKAGDMVEVLASDNKTLGFGHYAEGSICIRLFHFGPGLPDQDFWKSKIRLAYSLREKMGLTDHPNSNMYRLVHAEGDGLPGLIIDIYGSTAVIQTHSEGMYELRSVFAESLREIYGDRLKAIYDKSALKINKNSDREVADEYLFGEAHEANCIENGCAYKVDWVQGQKTGFFLDQRENRKLLGELSHGKKVLNMFCYSGGFSVSAIKGGASLVHSVDSSQMAVDLTNENLTLNGIDSSVHLAIKSDALDYLKNMKEQYDIIVLDPPAYAKHLSARHKAVQGYRRLNEAAFRKASSGTLVFTFSCSQAVDKPLFASTVFSAALDAGKNIRVLYQLHQPSDHPFSLFHPEGEYLKGLVVQVI